MQIASIFPTAIGIDEVDNISHDEYKHLLEYESKTIVNAGNKITENNYLLEDHQLFDLKNNLESKLQKYFFEIFKTESATPYITQSWLNFTYKNQFHHEHNHPNSFLSGVFYLNAVEDDKIFFHKHNDHMFEFEPQEFNLFNSHKWWIPVKTNDVIFFPSRLNHEVGVNETDECRISLAFNTFIKGEFGSIKNLKRLKI
jgi:uncharacterized protein (TIGR02466 family)